MNLLRLKKNEERRLRAGHVWIYSNEIDVKATPLRNFSAGEEVIVETHQRAPLGTAYVNPHSLITARLFSRRAGEPLDTVLITRRLRAALALRVRLYPQPYYRLVFGESDQLPGLIADRFGDILVLQINTAGMAVKTDNIIAACQAALPDVQHILLRNDTPARETEGLEKHIAAALGSPPPVALIRENNARFHLPLWEGQKTGWFYDHRLNRTRLQTYAPGRRVLDVFSYLGAWGIQAAMQDANEVVCIDASSTAARFIQENAHLNQLQNKVRVIVEDAFNALKALVQAKESFDLIILDPPAFIKKQKDRKEGLLAYQRLNEAALKLLEPEGILITCSCSMHASHEDLLQALRRAGQRTGSELQLLERGHQGADHPVHPSIPETDYLKMMIARKR
jgi:23S rRNA (cytosine1962-C5)-methyltransferase